MQKDIFNKAIFQENVEVKIFTLYSVITFVSIVDCNCSSLTIVEKYVVTAGS